MGGVLALAALLTAGACTSTGVRAAGPPSAPAATGALTVFAAASLTEAFDDLRSGLRTSNPGLSPTFSFAGSGALATQVEQGAPADVIATADTASMTRLSDAGLVEGPVIFAYNKLEILVEPGNPKHVRGLPDLSAADIKVVVVDDGVPAGRYTAEVLRASGVTIRPVSREVDVKAAVSKVATGEADATIVYVTDVRAAGSRGQGVEIADASNAVAAYPIGVVKATRHRAAAEAFVAVVAGGDGQQALRAHGFLPPT